MLLFAKRLAMSAQLPMCTYLRLVRICETSLPGGESVATDMLQREMGSLYEQHGTYNKIILLAAFQAYLIYLQDLAYLNSRQGFMSKLSARDGLPTFLGTELQALSVSSNKSLWRAEMRQEWEIAYNTHLTEWANGGPRIDELWPIPEDLDELEDVEEFNTMLYAVTSHTHGWIFMPNDNDCNLRPFDLIIEEIIMASEGNAKESLAVSKSSPLASPMAPDEPYSIFDKRQKALIILIVSTAATFSGFASNIYFPALPTIARDLDVSVELVNLTVTSYLIFQALAPSLWGPVSDVKGRRVAYCCTLIVFLGACVGLAETRNYATLVVLRCLQSTGSASTIAIGSGVIGDITTRAERGGFMGIFQAGLLVPVAVGPVIGGALAGSLGWRAIFTFLAIYCGAFLLLLIVLLPETLRSVVANGGLKPWNLIQRYPLCVYQRATKIEWNREAAVLQPGARKRIDVTGPFRILVSKHAAPIIGFLAIYYAVWQMSITAMSTLFEDGYGLGETQIGLTFIANGVGSMVGTLVTGKILDHDYRRIKAKHEASQARPDTAASSYHDHSESSFPLEKARLRLVPVFSLVQCLSILLFGWAIQFPARVHIAVPIASTFITGWTAVSAQSVVTTYLVDVFPDRGAAASASLNLARCLTAAAGTSFIMPLVNAIGVGVAFTICAAVQAAAVLMVVVQWRFAGAWRRESERKIEQQKAAEEEVNGTSS
ncbi:MFS general substrate transporter [Biscogniauxia sp. FL1348]|nr:MFS general substrate transporter [Biscogniauxia sp. FL1348]